MNGVLNFCRLSLTYADKHEIKKNNKIADKGGKSES